MKPDPSPRPPASAAKWSRTGQSRSQPASAAMRSAVYREFGGPIAVETVPHPAFPADGVVLEVKATGVCRSD